MIDVSALARLLVLRVELRALEPQLVAGFVGSALHGALGRALYRTACSFRSRASCRGCTLFDRCAYPALFATAAPSETTLAWAGVNEQAPRLLALAPEPDWHRPNERSVSLAAGDIIPFRLTLVGSAARHLPVLTVALNQLAARGLGRRSGPGGEPVPDTRRGALALVRITLEGTSRALYQDGRFVLAPYESMLRAVEEPEYRPRSVRIELITPLRLKRNGRIVGHPSPEDFFVALARRANLLAALDQGATGRKPVDFQAVKSAASTLQVVESATELVHVWRFSARQQQRMALPGIVGQLRWAGEALGELWPLLKWGELAQVGKATALGFGRYQASAQ